MRQRRQSQILKIITEQNIKTQEELTAELKREGFDTTQATVSRDIKELGLIKISSSDGGYKYASKPNGNVETKHIDAFSDAVVSINYALNNIVIRTFPGMAQAVCASCDLVIAHEVLGTIAGEDTILVITSSEESASKVCEKLKKMFKN